MLVFSFQTGRLGLLYLLLPFLMSTATQTVLPEVTVEKSTKPVHVVKEGLLSVSVFRNPVMIDGRERIFFNSHLQRRYKDEAGEFQTTHSLGKDDLSVAQLLLAKAREWIVEEEAVLRKKKSA